MSAIIDFRLETACVPLSLSRHLAQVLAQRLPSSQMSFIRLQPNHTFHQNLVQSVVGSPQVWSKVADARVAFYIVACVVVTVVLVQIQRSVV